MNSVLGRYFVCRNHISVKKEKTTFKYIFPGEIFFMCVRVFGHILLYVYLGDGFSPATCPLVKASYGARAKDKESLYV